MRDIAGYELSRDYAKLAELARTQSVVCIVDYYRAECRDVAQTLYSKHGGAELFQISARGISYVWAESIEALTESCMKCNVDFIVPLNETIAELRAENDRLINENSHLCLELTACEESRDANARLCEEARVELAEAKADLAQIHLLTKRGGADKE